METRVKPGSDDLLAKRYLAQENQSYSSGTYTGIYKAKVINTNDPQNRGRILVRVFKFDSQNEIDANYRYAYVRNLLGGPQGSGFFIVPPIGSVGFVGYLNSDGTNAIWLGGTNPLPLEVNIGDNETQTFDPLPVEMNDDPTTIVLKTQYPTRADNITNNNFYADGDEEGWIKAENLLKLSDEDFTILKFNQGRVTDDGYNIRYTYNDEYYTLEDDVILEGEIEASDDYTDPLNINYSNFLRIKDNEARIFYRTKVEKKNEQHQDAEHSAYNQILMNDSGINIVDVYDNSIVTDKDGIHLTSNISGDGEFELKDEWGNFVRMDQTGLFLHGANPTDNPQVNDPSGSYAFGEDIEILRFNNGIPGLTVKTTGRIEINRTDSGGTKLEAISIDSTNIDITDSQGLLRLRNNDIINTSLNFRVNANNNVDIIGNGRVKIIGNAKVQINNLVDIGAAVAQALNRSALIIAPPGTSGGPCRIAFPGQTFVKV